MFILRKIISNFTLFHFSLLCFLICSLGCTNKDENSSNATAISSQKDSVLNNLEKQYQYARTLQASQAYTRAIKVFKACLSYNSNNVGIQKQLEPIIVNAMTHILGSYQSMGSPETCVDYFYSLSQDPPPLIQKYCMRDVYSMLGYALSRTERMDEAEEITLKTLDMPLYNTTPLRLFRQYTNAAAVFYSNLNKQDSVIHWCHLAIEQAKRSDTPTNVQWITTLLGSVYKRTGKINEATDLLLQSAEVAHVQNHLHGEAYANNALAELFLYWNLPQYANEYATLAVQNAMHRSDDPMFATKSYTTKAMVMQQIGYTDSTSFFLQKANDYCQSLPYNSGRADIDYFRGTIIIEQSNNPDSIAKGLEILELVVAQGIPTHRVKAYQQLSRGYFKLNKKQQGEIMLDSMYMLLHQSPSSIYLDGAYADALAYYIHKQEDPKIKQYAIALLDEIDFRHDKQNAKKLVETIVKFQTEKKEQQLLLASVELENKTLHSRLYLISALGLITLTLAVFFYSRRMYLMQQQLMEQRLSAMLDNMEKVNQHSVQVEQQLTDILTEKDSRKEIEAVTPGLLKEKGEPKFRQRFEQLYPRFLPALKERIPNIGRKEELLSMLIVLEQDNHQIAALMGIAHSSVNMARYRLRQKFGLVKEESLDEVIKSLL